MLCRSISIDAWYAGAARLVSSPRTEHNILSKAWHDGPKKLYFFERKENMKKIFAFILATIMVVSLVPASVFAALSNCPKDHNINNCKWTEVDTVDPTCVTEGYTVYECQDCHTQFLGAFVAKLGHDYTISTADGKVHVDKPANCGDNTPGIAWVKCARCGVAGDNKCDVEKCEDSNCKLGYIVIEPKHNPVQSSANLGCLTVYTCTECDKDFYKNAKGEYVTEVEHDWKFDKTTEEPYYDSEGKAHNGNAQYKCSVCGDLKNVTILAEHTCKYERVSKYVAPKCGVAGAYAKWQCKTCLAIEYRDADNNKVNSKDGVIKALEHVKGDRVDDKTTCDATYKCTVCKANFTVKEHLNASAVQEAKATCTTYGYKVTYCIACGTSENIITADPLGHDMGKAVEVKKATCTEKGISTQTCKRENCSTPGGYTVTTEIPVDPSNHAKDTKTTPEGTVACGTTQIKITVCTRNCGMEPEVEIISNQHKWYVSSVKHNCGFATSVTNGSTWATQTVETCANCQETRTTVTYDNGILTSFATLEEAGYYHGTMYKVGYLDAKGNQKYNVVERTYSSATHTLTLDRITTPATCTTNAIGLYKCSHCAIPAYVEVPNTMISHVANDKGVIEAVPSTCTKAGNVEHSICKECGNYFDPTTGKTLKTIVINKHESDLTKVTVSDDDKAAKTYCNITTYYKCKCGKTFKKADATQEFNESDAHTWTTIFEGSEVNCNTAGKVEVRRCTTCYRVEGRAVLDGEPELLGFVIQTKDKAATLTLDYKLSTDKKADKKIEITKKYALKDSKDADLNIPKMEHKNLLTGANLITAYSGDGDVANKTCEGVTYKHWICSAEECDYEYLNNYNATTGGCVNAKGEKLTNACTNHEDAVCVYCGTDYNEETNWSELKVVEATCQNDGYKYQYCLDCGYREIVEVNFMDPDNHSAKTVTVPASFAGPGYTYTVCEWCGKELSKSQEIPAPNYAGVEIMLDTDRETYKPGDSIFVTVSLDSLMGVEVWGLNFAVSYNPETVKFVEYEFCMNDGSLSFFRVNNEYVSGTNPRTQKEYEGYNGIVNIAVNTTDGVSVKGSFDLVVLEFKVISAMTNATEFFVGDVSGWFTGYYSYSVVGINGVKLDAMKNGTNSTSVAIGSFLDLDDDGTTDMADAFQLYYLYITSDEYVAEADVNSDGVIDDEDIEDLYDILTGAVTLDEYINPQVKPEGTGSQIQPRA